MKSIADCRNTIFNEHYGKKRKLKYSWQLAALKTLENRDLYISPTRTASGLGYYYEAQKKRKRYDETGRLPPKSGPRPPPMNRRRAVSPPQGLRPLVLAP